MKLAIILLMLTAGTLSAQVKCSWKQAEVVYVDWEMEFATEVEAKAFYKDVLSKSTSTVVNFKATASVDKTDDIKATIVPK